MTRYDTAPYDGQPDSFDLIAGELLEQMVDPYLDDTHRAARRCEEVIRELDPDGESPYLRKQYTEYLDSLWRFNGDEITISGKGWFKNSATGAMFSKMLIGASVTSRGFIFSVNEAVTGKDGLAKVAHCVETTLDDQQVFGAICLDDVVSLQLPYPSPEMRARRFAYYHAHKAAELSEYDQTATRADQIVRDLGEFTIDYDPQKSSYREDIRDAEQALRDITRLETLANYEVSLLGDVLLRVKGELVPYTFEDKGTRIMSLRDVALLPADVYAQKPTGLARHAPFVEAVSFNANETDAELLIACRSIAKIRSLRYGS